MSELSSESSRSPRGPRFIAVGGLLLLGIGLVAVILLFNANQSGARVPIILMASDTSTHIPSLTPSVTPVPSETTTPQPTTRPYRRESGNIPTVIPTNRPAADGEINQSPILRQAFLGKGCSLFAKNQNPELDAAVFLADIETHAVVAAVYVRSNDSTNHGGIPPGTYQIFAALGQDWDGWTGRFMTNGVYYRFVEPVVFDTCPTSVSDVFGDYQYVEVTLLAAEAKASNIIPIAHDEMPRFTP
jgi:hypothetical protein